MILTVFKFSITVNVHYVTCATVMCIMIHKYCCYRPHRLYTKKSWGIPFKKHCLVLEKVGIPTFKNQTKMRQLVLWGYIPNLLRSF